MTFIPGEVIVSPHWLADRLEEITVVDVRPTHDYRELGHIPGAVNIPFDRLRDPSSVTAGMLPSPETIGSLMGEAGIDMGDRIVAYDGDRGVYASRFLLTAAVYGHDGPLHLLDGDSSVWRRVHSLDDSLPGTTQRNYHAERSTNAPIVERQRVEAAVDDDTILVDTRTKAEYAAAHIPGAVQLSWESLVDPDTHQLKHREAIEDILAAIGLTRDDSIILYCNTARRLSHTFIVLQHFGYDNVSFYEGSLTDWVRATSVEWSPTELANGIRSYGPNGVERVVAELGDDVLNRLKLVGLYHQKQSGFFMLRTKIPGGRLSAEQAEVIGRVANEFARAPPAYGGAEQNPIFGDRYLDLTTRQDIQMHWIRIEDIPVIWDRYESVGLTTMQACGNSVRNVVTCPAAGIDLKEIVDIEGIAQAITDRFLADKKYANLPRKFKVSVTGCHENCARAQINDLGLTPAIRNGRDGFTVHVGGGLSDGPRMASELDIFIEPHQVVELVEATADLFLESGSYLDTAVNRLRFLVEELGPDTVREELERRLSFEVVPPDESLTTNYRGDHVGIHSQEDGRRYIGLNVPTGRMLGRELIEAAALARNYGSGELRVTLNQNLLLPNVSPEETDALLDESLLDRYSPNPGPFTRGIVTCTGSEFCNFGIIETKSRGLRWARALDAWVDAEWDDPPEVIRMHMSGCSASCAQPQIADIGLRGEITRIEEQGELPAVDVGLGGDLENSQFIDWVVGALPIEDFPLAVRRLTSHYHADRTSPEESFTSWLRRADLELLQGQIVAIPEVS